MQQYVNQLIPVDIDYDVIGGLSNEVRKTG